MEIKVGDRFGKLIVIGCNITKNGAVICDCLCDCGKTRTLRSSSLKLGLNKSCGCLRYKHGLTTSNYRLFYIWSGMKSRCDNNHPDYGGRGISYDDRWKDFKNFYDDMIEGYEDHLSLDRIDVNGNYSKENCRWATAETQANNRRNNKFIEYNGERFTVTQLARKYGISTIKLRSRLNAGWDIEKALTKR